MKILFTFLICLSSAYSFSQTHPAKSKSGSAKNTAPTPKKEAVMKAYFMVFLMKGEKRDQDSITANKIQAEHIAHLEKMYNEGKMDIAGPFGDDDAMRGICIYNVATIEEAKKLAESDPAVVSGRLKVVVRPWYGMKTSSLR